MERLAIKNTVEHTTDLFCGYEDCETVEEMCPACIVQEGECQALSDALKKLFKYESTGLTPEQLKEIDKLYLEKCEQLNKFAFSQKYPIGCTLITKDDDEPGECTVIGYGIYEDSAYIILNDFTNVHTSMIERLFKVKEEANERQ